MSDVKTPEGIVATPLDDEPPSEQELRPLSRPSSLFGVFRHRNYRIFFGGQLITFLGAFVQMVAQGWLVYDLTRSAFLLGVTSFAALIPGFFLSPFAGAIADRVDRRKILIITRALALVQALVLAVLTLTHVVHVWHVIALALALGFVNAFDVPTRQALTLDLVGRSDLRSAISLNSMMFNSARILGPTIGGFVVALVGVGWCFAINGASTVAVLFSYFHMDIAKRPPRVHEHPLIEMKRGFVYAWNTRPIRVSLMLVAVTSCFGAAYLSMMPAIARDILHQGSSGLGMLMGSVGVGALFGAYALARIHDRHLAMTPPIAAAAFGVSIILFSLSRSLPLSMLLLFPVSFFLMLVGGATNTIIQTVAEEHLRGRVVALYTMSFMGMMPWGSLILGVLASYVGVANALMTGGAICILGAGVAWFDRTQNATPIGAPAE